MFRVRHRRRFELGFFLAEDHEKFVRGSSARGALLFTLSDAYFNIGQMELHFVGPPEGYEPTIPTSIRAIAEELRVPIASNDSISNEEGRTLYARLTGFSERTTAVLTSGAQQVDLVRACFVVQRGIWSVEQVEFFAREAYNPARLLEGGVAPENRLSFAHDLLVLRIAIAWERAKLVLEVLSGGQDHAIQPMTWTDSVATFKTSKDLEVRTLGAATKLAAGSIVSVLLLPRPREGFIAFSKGDLAAVKRCRPEFVAVTRDFPTDTAHAFEKRGAKVLVLLDTLADLDKDVYRRLAQSVSTARPLPERPE